MVLLFLKYRRSSVLLLEPPPVESGKEKQRAAWKRLDVPLVRFPTSPGQEQPWVTHCPRRRWAGCSGCPAARSQVGWRADGRCTQHYECAFVNKRSHGTRTPVFQQCLENNQENHVAAEVCRLPALPHSLTFSLPFVSFLSLSLCY